VETLRKAKKGRVQMSSDEMRKAEVTWKEMRTVNAN